jgi:dUTP pyrophosphatase
LVLPRSGLATKHGVTCANSPGLIDAGYRGELRVALVNLDPSNDYEVTRGDRIAQLVVVPFVNAEFRLVDELPPARRGDGGFGSSGR